MSVLGGRRLGCRRGPRSLVHSSQEQAAILGAKGKILEPPDAKAPFLMSTATSYSHTRMHSRTEHNKKRVPRSDDRFESRRHGSTPESTAGEGVPPPPPVLSFIQKHLGWITARWRLKLAIALPQMIDKRRERGDMSPAQRQMSSVSKCTAVVVLVLKSLETHCASIPAGWEAERMGYV
ncbi:hypothetical protein M441DRAFT_41109 [Trichoderma asperellum CBS 433.97]|uniref:Uncharacterized protein n=1 Tax=Trichoderma asperellum (strain ATCC 204424 / CBS 433.97 / NBRC 101777) TaxID=1042311 RepID=A0A2T3YTH8_TRIA4|nr:hypothetical protein M441DRAFT_41109 [Trichoderma asperellum CBS 433.97]PTB35814.1 hypothetical protein M441DRAFT_41109 [Trichoderma asperellum CBS 433.97]